MGVISVTPTPTIVLPIAWHDICAHDNATMGHLLAPSDPLERIRSLKSLRQLDYTFAHRNIRHPANLTK